MSNNLSFEQDLASGVVGIVFLALLVLLAFFALWIAIPLAILFFIYKIYHLYQNSDTVQERKAREHTNELYQHALVFYTISGTIKFFYPTPFFPGDG